MKRAGWTGLFLQEIRAAVQPLQFARAYPVGTGSFLDILIRPAQNVWAQE